MYEYIDMMMITQHNLCSAYPDEINRQSVVVIAA